LNNKIPIISSLRAIAASSVCLFHFVCTTTNLFSNKILLNIFYFGKYGVQLFFVVSGIVIPLSMIAANYRHSNFFKFIYKRFLRIEPPYVVSSLIAIVYLIIRNYVPSSANVDLTPSFNNVLLHLGYLVPFFENAKWINPVYWTLAIEFQYYMVLALLFPLLIHYGFKGRLIFYLIFISISFVFPQKAFFPYWSILFLCGIAFTIYFKKFIDLREYIFLILVCLILVLVNLGITNLIITLLVLFSVHFIANLDIPILSSIGTFSYSLYLLHSIIGSSFVNFFSHYSLQSYQKIILVLAGYFISLIGAYILYLTIEKPSQEWSRKISL
jgi:peptidoglycan/LPS O-acetylase OafA/YrhL